MNVSFVALMKVMFGSHIRWGAGYQGDQPSDRRVGNFSPASQPPRREERLEVESVN